MSKALWPYGNLLSYCPYTTAWKSNIKFKSQVNNSYSIDPLAERDWTKVTSVIYIFKLEKENFLPGGHSAHFKLWSMTHVCNFDFPTLLPITATLFLGIWTDDARSSFGHNLSFLCFLSLNELGWGHLQTVERFMGNEQKNECPECCCSTAKSQDAGLHQPWHHQWARAVIVSLNTWQAMPGIQFWSLLCKKKKRCGEVG